MILFVVEILLTHVTVGIDDKQISYFFCFAGYTKMYKRGDDENAIFKSKRFMNNKNEFDCVEKEKCPVSFTLVIYQNFCR